jgi:transcriptional regulator with XRE-family HTH domain
MDLGQAIAANVRSLRAHNDWQQSELAARLSVSQRSVSTLESGKRADVGIVELSELCRVFGVPLRRLLDGAADLRVLGL